jgi:uncharacterized protein
MQAPNTLLSTPLHWAALNAHMEIVQGLINFPNGPGVGLIDIKNGAGRTALGEAEIAGWEEGSAWLVGVMNLEQDDKSGGVKETSEADDELGMSAAKQMNG